MLMHVLLIDDDASLRKSLRLALDTMNHRVSEARNGAEAQEILGHHLFDVAFLDLRLGREEGLELLPVLLRLAPGLPVIVVTAYATIETAVEAMRRGAEDYLPKPFTPDQLRRVLDRVAHTRRLESQVEELEEQVRSIVPEADLQTEEPAVREALDVAFKAAASDVSILLRGESGTGKGVLARAIHARSNRSAAPFITVHCPSLSAELLESELFGHVRGAFTGAVQDTMGKITTAEGGTLFLDEIGDLPLALQPKLLRLLQDKQYERVGDTRTRVCNIRILAASNHDLAAAIAAGTVREDLFYRLNVIPVKLPPLRDRRDDIPLLVQHFLQKLGAEQVPPRAVTMSQEALRRLMTYTWPGNVRQLENIVERALAFSQGRSQIDVGDFGPEIQAAAAEPNDVSAWFPDEGMDLERYIEGVELTLIKRSLERTHGNKVQAAKLLNLKRTTLIEKLKRLERGSVV